MTTSTQSIETTNALIKFAKQDLRLAKKNGEIAIFDTKKGVIELQYYSSMNLFKAVNFNNTLVEHTGLVDSKEMISFLSLNYTID